jgi:integrase
MPAAHPSLGSIYQRARDGRWCAALSIAGRRIVRYGRTRKEAQEALQDILREYHTGQLATPTRCTLAEWVEQWFDLMEPTWRPSTQTIYRHALSPIMSQLGHMRLDKLTPLALAGTLVALRRQGRGSRSLEQTYIYLRGCLARAVALGLLSTNPLDRVQRPRHAARDLRYWTMDETRRFLQVAQATQDHYAPLFVFLLGTGCRSGEGLAVCWSDLDWQQRKVCIRRALHVVRNQRLVQSPKTAAGSRELTMPPFLLATLRQLPRPVADGPVFVPTTDAAPGRSSMRHHFRALCAAANVPPMPVHGLRHVHSAVLVAEGTDLQALRRRLGHTRASLSLDRYAYALRPDQQAADAIQSALDMP